MYRVRNAHLHGNMSFLVFATEIRPNDREFKPTPMTSSDTKYSKSVRCRPVIDRSRMVLILPWEEFALASQELTGPSTNMTHAKIVGERGTKCSSRTQD